MLFVVLAVLLAAAAAPGNAPLLLPLEHPAPLTSSFGEYRSGHFHGGLDYSTGGRVGLPVRAPGDGWVFRLRTSGVGYGKAVYFRLDDGRTALFAHLDRFHPDLENAAHAEQARLGRYETDLYPSPGQLRLSRGDILAYTGQSGAGPPHLHAELRVGEGASLAVNPVPHGWRNPDTIPPRLSRLRIVPAGAESLVDGSIEAAIVVLDGAQPAVSLSGPVRLWVETSDRSDGGGYRLAPHRLRTILDGEPWVELALDAVDWRWPAEALWLYDEPAARTHRERWVNLIPTPGARQSVYSGAAPSTPWTFSAGTHHLEIVAEDFAGNRTKQKVRFEVETASTLLGEAVRADLDALPRGFVSLGDHLRFVAGSGEGLDHPQLVLWAAKDTLPGTVFRSKPEPVVQWDRPSPGQTGLWTLAGAPALDNNHSGTLTGSRVAELGHALWVEPGTPARGRVRDLELWVPAGAAGEPRWIGITAGTKTVVVGSEETELTPASPLYRLSPWGSPLRERITVRFHLPSGFDPRGVGIYSRRGDRWSFEGAELREDVIEARLRLLEDLALLRDDVAPRVRLVQPEDGPFRPSTDLEVSIVDTGSGVTWRTMEMRLDGRPVIAEWDPDAKRLRSREREPLSVGPHRIDIEAADRAGNTSARAFEFSVE